MNWHLRYLLGMGPLFVVNGLVNISEGLHGWHSWAHASLLGAAYFIGMWVHCPWQGKPA